MNPHRKEVEHGLRRTPVWQCLKRERRERDIHPLRTQAIHPLNYWGEERQADRLTDYSLACYNLTPQNYTAISSVCLFSGWSDRVGAPPAPILSHAIRKERVEFHRFDPRWISLPENQMQQTKESGWFAVLKNLFMWMGNGMQHGTLWLAAKEVNWWINTHTTPRTSL